MGPKAVVLLSGGLDSAVTLYYALKRNFDCLCLIFDYGQRHKKEIECARRLAGRAGCRFRIIELSLPWKGSSLLEPAKKLPERRTAAEIRKGIPSTYVPARNTVFLSMAVSCAEAIGASTIFMGAHFEDSSGYPDCRKSYINAFQKVIRLGTKAGLKGELTLSAPLIGKTKKEIISLGRKLGVPFDLTRSCYAGGRQPCGVCDSCILRARGFREARIADA